MDGAGHGLASPRGPADFDLPGVVSVPEAEIQRQVALGEVPRLSVEDLQNPPPSGQHDGHLRTEPLAVRAPAPKPDVEEVDAMSLREVADQHLWTPVEL